MDSQYKARLPEFECAALGALTRNRKSGERKFIAGRGCLLRKRRWRGGTGRWAQGQPGGQSRLRRGVAPGMLVQGLPVEGRGIAFGLPGLAAAG